MSKDNTNEPDEYENIFDDAYNKQNHDVAKIIDVTENIQEDENLRTEVLEEMHDIDAVYKKDNIEPTDDDIEDGIFAPERKAIKTSKKSSSLIWSVSVLAMIGVAGFVYFSNPDILSKVSNNLQSGNDVILPQDTVTEQPDMISAPETALQLNQNSDANIPPIDMVIPQVEGELIPPSNVQPEQIAVAELGAINTPVTMDSPQDLANKSPAENTLNFPTETEINNSEVIAKDVILPQEKSSEEAKALLTESIVLSTPEVAPTIAPPIAEGKTEANKKSSSEKIEQKSEMESQTENIVVVNSKEEQKVLDDAGLDKYFDSPNGKMLKDIPAPSMDPKKGSGQSIIIVNKKGQANSADSSSKKLSIEMTSLSQQTVNANRALKLGRFEAAKEMYDELYRLNPKDESVLSGRALVLQKMGQEDQAISAYEQLLKIYPDNVDAVINLSGLMRKQYPAVALNKLLDLHMEHPNNVFVTAQLGITYADAGNYPDAVRYLNSAISMDPKNAQHAFNLAVILEKSGNPKEAIKNYEKALETDSIFGEGKKSISREKIYDRLSQLRGN